ncbi:MAG: alpha/beta hydrolase [Beijerinckiaceae bacterium]
MRGSCIPAALLLAVVVFAMTANAAAPAGLRQALVEFANAPFPYDGEIPGERKPFLDTADGTRRGHTSPRGGVYWLDQTYSDRRVLLAIPPHFDPHRPAYLVVYFHGNNVILERDVVARQQVPQQLAASGLNAVLVAPQFASDALDSSAGRFWQPHVFAEFLDEAAARLAVLYGDRSVRSRFDTMPVVLVAYSGGYMPASAAISAGGANDRIAGLILLDALYGEIDTFADWIAKRRGQSFFFSAYSASTAAENLALQQRLAPQAIAAATSLPEYFRAGTIAFLAAGDVAHNDFVTQAWTRDPLRAVLTKLKSGR